MVHKCLIEAVLDQDLHGVRSIGDLQLDLVVESHLKVVHARVNQLFQILRSPRHLPLVLLHHQVLIIVVKPLIFFKNIGIYFLIHYTH